MANPEETILEILKKAKDSGKKLSTDEIQMYSLIYSDDCSDKVVPTLAKLEREGKIAKKIENKKIIWELN